MDMREAYTALLKKPNSRFIKSHIRNYNRGFDYAELFLVELRNLERYCRINLGNRLKYYHEFTSYCDCVSHHKTEFAMPELLTRREALKWFNNELNSTEGVTHAFGFVIVSPTGRKRFKSIY